MCAAWSYSKYRTISKKLRKIEDIGRVSREYNIHPETLLIIFQQKEVRRIMRLHGKVIRKRDELLRKWKEGMSILELAEIENFSPMLMAQIILVAMDVSKKKTKKISKNPEMVEDERLEREIRIAMSVDHLYSPEAHEKQRKRGEEGERKLFVWLDANSIRYIKEEEMPRKEGMKTPDVLLESPIKIGEWEICWIDSKASFGDPEEIKRAYRKQFRHYIKLFGPGAVIYWYGFVKTDFPRDLLVLDSLPEKLG